MDQIKLTDSIYYLGFNDRRTHLFENMWPIPYGIAYNSYLIKDGKVALIDTVEHQFIDDYFEKIDNILQGKKIDYLVINHMEPDHSGALKAVTEKYPDIIVVGNKKTFDLIENFYKKPKHLLLVDNGSHLNLGKTVLQFHMIPMVHWPETMVTFDESDQILFSGDAFGSFGTLDGGVFDDELNLEFFQEEAMRYFTNVVGKYCLPTSNALKKLSLFKIRMIAAAHGPIWRTDLNWILSRYKKWSKYKTDPGVVIVYGSMYGNTEKMAEVIARQLSVNGVKNIRVYDVSRTHASYIISDIFKYKGLIVGAPTYNMGLFPPVYALLNEIADMKIKDHYLGFFGNYSWSGGAVTKLKVFAENMNWEMVAEPVEEKSRLKAEKYDQCLRLADAMAVMVL